MDRLEEPALIAEPHFPLGGVNVHVHFAWVAPDIENRQGMAPHLEQPSIGALHRRHQGALVDPPAIDHQNQQVAVGLGYPWHSQNTDHGNLVRRGVDRDQLVGHPSAEYRPGRFHEISAAGGSQSPPATHPGLESDVWPAQSGLGHDPQAGAALGAHGPQKLSSGRGVVEQVTHLNRGPRGGRHLDRRPYHVTGNLDPGPGPRLKLARHRGNSGHGGDTCQRLPAEPEGGNPGKIVDFPEFAGGVPLEGHRQLLGRHAQPVVHHANQLAAASFDLHGDSRCASVETILHQLLDDRCRPLDHLPGCDRVCHLG